jgi:hypothetical protein
MVIRHSDKKSVYSCYEYCKQLLSPTFEKSRKLKILPVYTLQFTNDEGFGGLDSARDGSEDFAGLYRYVASHGG